MSIDLVPVTPIIYAAPVHSFFDDLATMVFSLFSHMFTATTFQIVYRYTAREQSEGRPLESVFREISMPIQYMDFGMSLEMASSDESFIVKTAWLQTPINGGSWPTFVEMYRVPKNSIVPGQEFGYRKNQRVFQQRIVGSSFISYYSSQEPRMEARYTDDKQKWPDVLNFARLVRNGFAHGGKLNITNQNTKPITWKMWTFGPSDNGIEFFLTSDGLGIGDIILLFEDVHNAIYL